MNALLNRLRAIRRSDEGLGLVEVLVAMMIFAIISVGVAYTLLSSFTFTNDSRSREVATNLAAQEIDLDRSAADIFALQSYATPKTVQVPTGGIPYQINRTVNWVNTTGSDIDCGAPSGSLLYKRIHVEVTWPNMVGAPVDMDTVLAPDSKINADNLGTILVSTTSSTGNALSGVTVAVSPNPGSTPPLTDAQGCSYVLKVPPGTYTVTVSRANYIDPNQTIAPTKTVTVTAGTSSSAGFTLDQQGVVTVKYATNLTAFTPFKPTDLTATFSSTFGDWTTPNTAPASVNLFPASDYSVVAGPFVSASDVSGGCLSPDPGQWPASSSGGPNVASPDPVTVSFQPGGLATANLPMGIVKVTNTAGFTSNAYLVAKSTTPLGNGDPGCATGMTFNFGQIMNKAKNSTVNLALPYGTWKLTMGTTSSPTTVVTQAQLSVPSGATGTNITSTGVFTLDPRVVVP